MKELIILDLGTQRNKNMDDDVTNYRYDGIIDVMIKAKKIKYSDPNVDILLKIDSDRNEYMRSNILSEKSAIRRILLSVFDNVIETDLSDRKLINKLKSDKYKAVRKLDSSLVGVDDSDIDTDYEYHQIKQHIGPTEKNHFMFKERDLEIQQRIRQKGGFDFETNKLTFEENFDPRLKTVCELYKIDCKYIKHSHLNYYHTEKDRRYQPYDVRPMFGNINEYDYLTPLAKLSEYHSENNYYSKLLNRNKKYLEDAFKNRIRLNLIDKISPDDKDTIMTQYVKCRPNTFVMTMWGSAISTLDKFIEILENSGNVYYVKTINLSRRGLMNLMFWYYDNFSFNTALEFIEKKLEYINAVNENNAVCMIIFDNVQNKRLSGQESQFKKELRSTIIENLRKLKLLQNEDGNDKYKGRDMGYDMIHINDYFYQTVEYSQILLNKNTLDMLGKQDCFEIASDACKISNLKFQTLRKIMYSEMSLLESDRLIATNGIIFYAYGIRAFENIDIGIMDIEPNSSPKLQSTIDNLFLNDGTKFNFINAEIEGTKSWRKTWFEIWIVKYKKILEFLGINNFKDVILDPNNFFYFQGIKFIKLEFEILKKLIRNMTKDQVDFMMINLLNPEIIESYITLSDKYSDQVTSSESSHLDKNRSNANEFFKISDKFDFVEFQVEFQVDFQSDRNDNAFDKRRKILSENYSNEQIQTVKNMQAFRDFFEKN